MHRSLPSGMALLGASALAIATFAGCGSTADETLTTTTTTHAGGSGGSGAGGGTGAAAGTAGTGGVAPCPDATITDHSFDQNTGDQVVPKVSAMADGSSWLAWYSNEQSNYDVRAQRVDSSGNGLLGTHGLLVSGHPSDTWIADFSLVTDHEQAAIVAFSDIRSGHFDPVGYRIAEDGTFAWGADGVALAASTLDGFFPKAVVTTSNDVVFAWERFNDTDTVHEVVLQRVGPDGTLRWGSGVTIPGTGGNLPVRPWLVGTGAEDVIVVWEETPAAMSLDRTIYARRLDAQGAEVWSGDTTVSSGQQVQFYVDPVLEPDDTGGVFVAWAVVSGNQNTAYVQHLDADGAATMAAGGVGITTSTTTQQLNTGLGWVAQSQELVVAWVETNMNQDRWGLRAQRFTPAGDIAWPPTGQELVALSDKQVDLAAVRGLGDRALLFQGEWSFGNVTDVRILGGALDLTASPTWAPEVLSDVQSGKGHPFVSAGPGCNGFWMVWEDLRTDLGDVFGGWLLASP